jgi:hypothetical protein
MSNNEKIRRLSYRPCCPDDNIWHQNAACNARKQVSGVTYGLNHHVAIQLHHGIIRMVQSPGNANLCIQKDRVRY